MIVNKTLLTGFVLGVTCVLTFVMLFTMLQYVLTTGIHNAFEGLPSFSLEDYIRSQAFANLMLFVSSFIIMIAVLTLFTHGAIIKAAKKFVPAYVAFVAALFLGMGAAGLMIALVLTIFSLLVIYQFALKDVMRRTPASGPEEDIGSEGVVVERIDDENAGKVKVGDTIWWATSSDDSIIEEGEKVRVERASGKKLVLVVRRSSLREPRRVNRRKCPHCGYSISGEATFCPNCGASLD